MDHLLERKSEIAVLVESGRSLIGCLTVHSQEMMETLVVSTKTACRVMRSISTGYLHVHVCEAGIHVHIHACTVDWEIFAVKNFSCLPWWQKVQRVKRKVNARKFNMIKISVVKISQSTVHVLYQEYGKIRVGIAAQCTVIDSNGGFCAASYGCHILTWTEFQAVYINVHV